MSTIRFDDYDKAYIQIKRIYDLIQKDGARIVQDLKKLCDDLGEKWVADDALIHINSLVNIQNNLQKYFVSSVKMVTEVSARVVSIQKTASAVSRYMNVGDDLPDVFEGAKNSEDATGSDKYKLESLKDEYYLLDSIINDFLVFKNNYSLYFDDFFDNWKDDPKKQDVVTEFTDFIDNLDKYVSSMDTVRLSLQDVVSNTEQILEG